MKTFAYMLCFVLYLIYIKLLWPTQWEYGAYTVEEKKNTYLLIFFQKRKTEQKYPTVHSLLF